MSKTSILICGYLRNCEKNLNFSLPNIIKILINVFGIKSTIYFLGSLSYTNLQDLLYFDIKQLYPRLDSFLVKNSQDELCLVNDISFNIDISKAPQRKRHLKFNSIQYNDAIISNGAFGSFSVIALNEENNQRIFCLGYHYFQDILKDDNSLTSQGVNLKYDSHVMNEIKFQFKSNIIKIACGVHHTLFLTMNGSVFSIYDVGICEWKGYTEIKIKEPDSYKLKKNTKNEPRILQLFNIIDINCGAYHNLCLDENGKLFSWGCNTYGQTGHSIISHLNDEIPSVPVFFKNKQIKYIQCGWTHSLAMQSMELNYNSCYLFGNNSNGQIGIGELDTNLLECPFEINKIGCLSNKLIKAASLGWSHSLLLCHDNSIFAFGNNCSGQCSYTTSDLFIWRPRLIETKQIGLDHEELKIIQVIAGFHKTLIVYNLMPTRIIQILK